MEHGSADAVLKLARHIRPLAQLGAIRYVYAEFRDLLEEQVVVSGARTRPASRVAMRANALLRSMCLSSTRRDRRPRG